LTPSIGHHFESYPYLIAEGHLLHQSASIKRLTLARLRSSPHPPYFECQPAARNAASRTEPNSIPGAFGSRLCVQQAGVRDGLCPSRTIVWTYNWERAQGKPADARFDCDQTAGSGYQQLPSGKFTQVKNMTGEALANCWFT